MVIPYGAGLSLSIPPIWPEPRPATPAALARDSFIFLMI